MGEKRVPSRIAWSRKADLVLCSLRFRRSHSRLHIHVVIDGDLPITGLFHHHLQKPSAQASLGIAGCAWWRTRC